MYAAKLAGEHFCPFEYKTKYTLHIFLSIYKLIFENWKVNVHFFYVQTNTWLNDLLGIKGCNFIWIKEAGWSTKLTIWSILNFNIWFVKLFKEWTQCLPKLDEYNLGWGSLRFTCIIRKADYKKRKLYIPLYIIYM